MAQDPTGWMPGVERAQTAAYGYADMGEDSMYPKAVMSHVMQGYQRTMLEWAAERPYHNAKSAHFTIGRDGRIVQHVSIWDPAWSAGGVSRPSWRGIQAHGPNPNRYIVAIEHEGFSIAPSYGYDYIYDAAHPWPQPLVDASLRVHRWVFEACANWLKASEDSVITHSMTDAVSRAQDPGDVWLQAVRPGLILALQSAVPNAVPTVSMPTYADGFAAGKQQTLDALQRAIELLR